MDPSLRLPFRPERSFYPSFRPDREMKADNQGACLNRARISLPRSSGTPVTFKKHLLEKSAVPGLYKKHLDIREVRLLVPKRDKPTRYYVVSCKGLKGSPLRGRRLRDTVGWVLNQLNLDFTPLPFPHAVLSPRDYAKHGFKGLGEDRAVIQVHYPTLHGEQF